jgi:leader peptidase (prepilin peptidase)/N-methyltransferase
VQPVLIIVLATLAGVPLGLWLRRNLATLSYRNADESDRPEPSPRWWVVWVSILALGSLAAAAVLSRDPLAYLPLVPITASGPWLAAVDFDVLRIPNRVMAPTALVSLLTIVGMAAATQHWRTLVVSIVAASLVGGVFAVVHFATNSGIGFGDVKLAAAISLAIGSFGAATAWLGVLAGSVAALVWATASRKVGPISYGPWLLCGAWFAVLASPAAFG